MIEAIAGTIGAIGALMLEKRREQMGHRQRHPDLGADDVSARP